MSNNYGNRMDHESSVGTIAVIMCYFEEKEMEVNHRIDHSFLSLLLTMRRDVPLVIGLERSSSTHSHEAGSMAVLRVFAYACGLGHVTHDHDTQQG